MNPETTNTLVVGGLILAAAGVGAYYLARYLKGSVSIMLARNSFNAGEAVEGSFELLARKEISANTLTAFVAAYETVRERDFRGRSKTRTREIYRTGQTVEQARVYPAGYRGSYNFRIPLPDGHFGGGGAMLGSTLGFLSGASRNVSWKVEVRLDAEGVDLGASEKIYVG
jgi:hypothetical protein